MKTIETIKSNIMRVLVILTFMILMNFHSWSTELSSPIGKGMFILYKAVDPELQMESWMLDAGLFSVTKSEKMSVLDIASSNADFSILVEAVTKAGLGEVLSGEGPFTVFAPTNDAFRALFDKLEIEGVKDLSPEQLVPVLTYHVVAGKLISAGLPEGRVSTFNEGKSLAIDLSEGVKINGCHVVKADIEGSNGVIHVIDQVLLPE